MLNQGPQKALANDLHNQVAQKYRAFRYLPIDELRIYVLSDDSFSLFEAHATPGLQFAAIDKLGAQQAHLWWTREQAERADFQVYFCTGRFHP